MVLICDVVHENWRITVDIRISDKRQEQSEWLV
jgi:hypothetical protein